MLRAFTRICAVALLATTVQSSCVDNVDTCIANTGTQEECDARGSYEGVAYSFPDPCMGIGGPVIVADDKCTHTAGFKDVADYICSTWVGYDCGTDIIFCDDAVEATDYTLADCAAVRDNCCAACAVFTRDDTVCLDNGNFKDEVAGSSGNEEVTCAYYAGSDSGGCGEDASLRANCCQSCAIYDSHVAEAGDCDDVGTGYSNIDAVQEACLFSYDGSTWNGYNCEDVIDGGYCQDESYEGPMECCKTTCDCECTGDCPEACKDVGGDIVDETLRHAAQEKCLKRGSGDTWDDYYCEYDPEYCASYYAYIGAGETSYPEYEECCAVTCDMFIPCELRQCHAEGGDFTCNPTQEPSQEPTGFPSQEPTGFPSQEPTGFPSQEPTGFPSQEPTLEPTEEPTEPTMDPTGFPSQEPTIQPSSFPTEEPTAFPTEEPTEEPTAFPTEEPTVALIVEDQSTSRLAGEVVDVTVTADQTSWITKALQCGTCIGDIDITNVVVGNKISKENWDELPEEEQNAIMDAAALDGTCSVTLTDGTCTVVADGAQSTNIKVACCGADPFADCPATNTWEVKNTEGACETAGGTWTQSAISARLEALNESADVVPPTLVSSATMLSAGATLLILLL